jgi:Na+/H+-dicarboxylate symporter
MAQRFANVIPPMTDAPAPTMQLPDVRVPAGWTLGGLAAGLALGVALSLSGGGAGAIAAAEWLGGLWLQGLKMTIVPLVVALLVTGIVRTVAAAQAGRMAAWTLAQFVAILLAGTLMAALLMPLLLDAFPIPVRAAAALREGLAGSEAQAAVPSLTAFVTALIPGNVLAAAATDAILPTIVFFALFAVALTRLPAAPRAQLSLLFEGIAGAMMVVIGWVLWLAPVGVFALSLAVAGRSGTAAIGALAHYIVLVAGIGAVVLVAAYFHAALVARVAPARFARAMLPAQAVAISTQSSLASVPAMLESCRRLALRERSGEFVLPLAVALFRATGPAMNLAVALYVARLTGVEVTPAVMGAGIVVAMLTTLGAPSLPGAISFVSSIGPIALAMGVPLGPLALLVAVEVLPDIMRTLGNVTMDVSVAAAVDRHAVQEPASEASTSSQA